ncbi:helix-turn-helix domain-containing protein [Paenibacillus bouchesdurhonensis]|uniref:helix-turn-helix transcriptional regulator n=1 Tax=Paenibacillus bouchesdurhonensis TaxID=1870990 RepID=UPI000DA62E18|nr:helix-turn-helix transcriptional regulator [Paenibacillus bouchesdurhonensis]
MSLVESIKHLCKQAGTSIPKLEKELGFGHGSMYNWDVNSPSIDKVQKVANYFYTTMDNLISGSAQGVEERELNFNNYVRYQAKGLLNEVKSNALTYGEVIENLLKCEESAKWSNPKNPYLLVIAEAKQQLKKEIDVTTLG